MICIYHTSKDSKLKNVCWGRLIHTINIVFSKHLAKRQNKRSLKRWQRLSTTTHPAFGFWSQHNKLTLTPFYWSSTRVCCVLESKFDQLLHTQWWSACFHAALLLKGQFILWETEEEASVFHQHNKQVIDTENMWAQSVSPGSLQLPWTRQCTLERRQPSCHILYILILTRRSS